MACTAELIGASAAGATAGIALVAVFAPPPIDLAAAAVAVAAVAAFIGAEWALYNCLEASGKPDEAAKLKQRIDDQQRQLDELKRRLGV